MCGISPTKVQKELHPFQMLNTMEHTPLEIELCRQLVAETRRRLIEEGTTRIEKCINFLSEEEIWERPNAHSNSVGNLVLHLCGNVRQYILSGIAQQPDTRKRQREFDQTEVIASNVLLNDLHSLMKEVDIVLEKLTPQQLAEPRKVQGFDETVLSILVHVTEHFSYHVGQISYYVKAKQNRDLGYYEGLNLDAKSS